MLSATDAEDFDRTVHNLAVLPTFTTTTNKKVAKALLLRGWFFCRGEMREPLAEHKGLGVYEISSRIKP